MMPQIVMYLIVVPSGFMEKTRSKNHVKYSENIDQKAPETYCLVRLGLFTKENAVNCCLREREMSKT